MNMATIKAGVIIIILSIAGFSQTKQIPSPNCSFGITLSPPGTSHTAAYPNNPSGTGGLQCSWWSVAYRSNGLSAESVTFQSANDANGVPGTFGNFEAIAQSGTLVAGTNPNTSTTTGYMQFSGYAPWVRVQLAGTTGTGSINGTVYGWLQNPFGSSGGGGGGTITCSGSGCVVIGPTATGAAPTTSPVFVAGVDGAGNIFPLQNCTLSATFDTSTSGNTSLVALSGTTKILVCHWSATAASAVDVKLVQGTGSTCGTGTADFTGLYQSILAVAFDWGAEGALVSSAGSRVCMNLSAAVRTTGTITYARY